MDMEMVCYVILWIWEWMGREWMGIEWEWMGMDGNGRDMEMGYRWEGIIGAMRWMC